MLFADPRNVADVEECVRAVRSESPHCKGRHGVGMRRDVGFVLEAGTPAFVQSLDDAVIAIMIEKESAVENLEALLSVKGVDMVQFGPADYSMSIGIPGQFRHPKVKEAEKFVIETCQKMGVNPRAEINDPSQAKEYLDMGVKHFCMGNDTTVLFDWFKTKGKEIGNLVGRSPSDEIGEEDRRGYRG